MKLPPYLALLLLVHYVSAASRLTPIESTRVGGELGRRIDITFANNILALDVDRLFIDPLHTRKAPGGYIGIGKFIDSTSRLAAFTRDERLLKLQKHLVTEVIKTQEPDGYIGTFEPGKRVWQGWDACESGYIIYGLVTDYRLFHDRPALDAARKLADYLIAQWPTKPARWNASDGLAEDVMLPGFDRAFVALREATGESR